MFEIKNTSSKNVCVFHVLMRVEVRHLKKYLHFTLKTPNCGVVAVLLIEVHHTQLKIICDEKPSISFKIRKNLPTSVLFLRSSGVACSFTKNKTPSQVFLIVCNKIIGSLYGTTLQLSTDKYDLHIVTILYKWSAFLIFKRERISYDPYRTRWYHFSHSFFWSVMDPPGVLFVASITVWYKTNFRTR